MQRAGTRLVQIARSAQSASVQGDVMRRAVGIRRLKRKYRAGTVQNHRRGTRPIRGGTKQSAVVQRGVHRNRPVRTDTTAAQIDDGRIGEIRYAGTDEFPELKPGGVVRSTGNRESHDG